MTRPIERLQAVAEVVEECRGGYGPRMSIGGARAGREHSSAAREPPYTKVCRTKAPLTNLSSHQKALNLRPSRRSAFSIFMPSQSGPYKMDALI